MRTHDGCYINPPPSPLQLALATLSRCVPGADTAGFSLDLIPLPDGTLGVDSEGQARLHHIDWCLAVAGLREAVKEGYAIEVNDIYIPSASFCKQIQDKLAEIEACYQQMRAQGL